MDINSSSDDENDYISSEDEVWLEEEEEEVSETENIHRFSTKHVNNGSYDDQDSGPPDALPPFKPERTPGAHFPESFTRQDRKKYLTPLSIFSLFFTSTLVRELCNTTNQNAAFIGPTKPAMYKNWTDVGEEEFMSFIGLLMYMGMIQAPNVQSYWNKKSLFNGLWAKAFMTRPRFEQILSFLKVSNRNTKKAEDKLIKVRFLFDFIRRKCMKLYQPGPNISIDERMVRNKGRYSFRQYIRDKPTKWGMKLWVLADSVTGYTYDFDVYLGTIGLSLSPCSVPGSGPSFSLQPDEMELGLGVHGEAGVRRMKVQTAREAVKTMMDHMTNPSTSTHIDLKQGDRVALMVNNLGGTSVLEMNIVAKEAISYLENLSVSVDRAYCGTYMTSLEMAGISITVLHIDDNILEYLDYPSEIPAWHPPYLAPGQKLRMTPALVKLEKENHIFSDAGCEKLSSESTASAYKALRNACEQLIAMEKTLNELDTQSGDGDCGSTLALGAKAILKQLGESTKPGFPVDCPYTLALSLGHITENVMGGSSGALYSLFFTSAAQELKAADSKSLCAALNAGLESIIKYGGAKPGYRTMVDPLFAACESLKSMDPETLTIKAATKLASEAAKIASEQTIKMDAQAGRASYVNKSLLTKPDPGAVAVAAWLNAVASSF